MNNLLFMLMLVGKPKLNHAQCLRVTDMMVDIAVKELDKDSTIALREVKVLKKME
jgi:hypothetical protein